MYPLVDNKFENLVAMYSRWRWYGTSQKIKDPTLSLLLSLFSKFIHPNCLKRVLIVIEVKVLIQFSRQSD